MAIDTNKIATAAQAFMAALESDEEFDNSTIAEVGIVVHVRIQDEDGNERDSSPTYCTNDSRIYQTGLFRWAMGGAEWSGEVGDEPDPDERD
jgi:hypothetical protein